jgi:hypothetical protein
MKRVELYSLVWAKPMIHVAKGFGMSDVGLRKICVKHNIPTPPLGYWAKLAHQKPVRQLPLPPLKSNESDHVNLVARTIQDLPAEVTVAQREASEREAAREIPVPDVRPEILHRSVTLMEKALHKQKPDHEGFVNCGGSRIPRAYVGPNSTERAILFVDTFIKALLERNYELTEEEEGLRTIVDGEPFGFRIYETKDRRTHELTSADLKQQAEYDERRKRHPDWYKEKTVWRPWDYFPSGRLAFEVTDPSQYRWNGEHVVGRWHDRGSKQLEQYIGEAIVALVTGAAMAKHRRAEAERQERIRAEAAEARRKEEARREREKRRVKFLEDKSDEYARFSMLSDFNDFLSDKVQREGIEPIDRMAGVLRGMLANMASKLDRSSLNEEITKLNLFAEDDQA